MSTMGAAAHGCAGDAFKKPNAEAPALGGTLNQPRNIRHHEATVLAHIDHTEVRIQGGEGVVRDLRARVRNRGDQGRFTRVRQAPRRPTSAITFHFEEQVIAFSPGRPGPYWRGERLVLDLKRWLPQPPLPPLGDEKNVVLLWKQVGELLTGIGILNSGAHRHRDVRDPCRRDPYSHSSYPLRRARPGRYARCGNPARVLMLLLRRADRRFPPSLPSPPSGPPKGHEFLTTKTSAAAAAVTGLAP